jgi:predicted patatin/cPLA2 family phospholipase
MSKSGELPGRNSRAVLDLVLARLDGGGIPDGRRLGLVIEGGAMRSIYTTGSLLALHLINSRDAFDDVYGTSAGAINGAHFLSGIGHTKVATYYRLLDRRKFINPWRVSKVVDIDYFVDDVLGRIDKVEVDLVNQARSDLWVAVLNVRTAEVEIRNPRREAIPLLLMLKAAMAIPVLYGRTIFINNNEYIDAGFVQPFALTPAIRVGCTHLLVLAARPVGHRSSPPPWWRRQLFNRRCAKRDDKLRSLYRVGWERQNEERRLAEGAGETVDDVSIATIAPDAARISPTTTDPVVLRDELIRMCRIVLDAFDAPHSGLERLIAEGVV